jgi:acetylornithine deacetylase/succinyl-diaminopimelate desuccinylase-like protein
VLVYGHYDVQPADPLHEWHDDPFSGAVKNNYIYGRGASDDKGQVFIHIKAAACLLRTTGTLPVNIKFLIEGEEETGSENLFSFIDKHPALLRADTAVVSDMRIPSPGQPAITYALRGMLSMEIKLRGQQQDVHSGNFGGAIHNPIQALCEMLSRLHDTNGRIAIPGLYDTVTERSIDERNYMKATGPSNKKVLQDAGATTGWGERGYSLYERISTRPSLSINGITGGYQEAGSKAIIPSTASAKLSFRLAPNQHPVQIEKLFRQFITSITPPAMQCSIATTATAEPVVVDINNQYMQAASRAYHIGFGKEPVFLALGGTIPVVAVIKNKLNIPPVLMGFALPDDNLHGPNERFYLPNFFNGIKTSMAFMELLGAPATTSHRMTTFATTSVIR